MTPTDNNARPGTLGPFLNPRSVALFGSVQEGSFFGPPVIIKDLQRWHYAGDIYPVHPSAAPVYGLKTYPEVSQVPGGIDLAVIMTSWRHVPAILEQCGRKGVRAAVVVADGFGETGAEGRIREKELLAIARRHGIRIIGPNTLGIFNTVDRFTTMPYEKGYEYTRTGALSIVTQTGMYGPQAVALNEYPFGLNKIIDLGNMCDVDEIDCLELLARDPGTEVISLYLEHTRRSDRFLELVRRISLAKPVLCLKGGRSQEAAGAMASHTGSLAADDLLYEGLFRQTGVIRVEEYKDLLDCAKPFLCQPPPAGNRLGIITFSGAIGIQCIDAAQSQGLAVGRLSARSSDRLSRASGYLGGHPIDLGPAAAAAGPEVFRFYLAGYDALGEDDDIDLIYFNAYASDMLRPEYYTGLFEHMRRNDTKPTVMWAYGPSAERVREIMSLAESFGIPSYPTNQKAILALGCMHRYAAWRRSRNHA
jgi:acyl-CoA synthetase (NDP forming)